MITELMHKVRGDKVALSWEWDLTDDIHKAELYLCYNPQDNYDKMKNAEFIDTVSKRVKEPSCEYKFKDYEGVYFKLFGLSRGGAVIDKSGICTKEITPEVMLRVKIGYKSFYFNKEYKKALFEFAPNFEQDFKFINPRSLRYKKRYGNEEYFYPFDMSMVRDRKYMLLVERGASVELHNDVAYGKVTIKGLDNG